MCIVLLVTLLFSLISVWLCISHLTIYIKFYLCHCVISHLIVFVDICVIMNCIAIVTLPFTLISVGLCIVLLVIVLFVTFLFSLILIYTPFPPAIIPVSGGQACFVPIILVMPVSAYKWSSLIRVVYRVWESENLKGWVLVYFSIIKVYFN